MIPNVDGDAAQEYSLYLRDDHTRKTTTTTAHPSGTAAPSWWKRVFCCCGEGNKEEEENEDGEIELDRMKKEHNHRRLDDTTTTATNTTANATATTTTTQHSSSPSSSSSLRDNNHPWARSGWTLCFQDSIKEDTFLCYFYEHRMWSIGMWLVIAAVGIGILVPLLLDERRRALAMQTEAIAAVAWVICVILLLINAQCSRELRHDLKMPSFAPTVDSGQWLYVDAVKFRKLSNNAKLHEIFLIVAFVFSMAACLFQYFARLKWCPHKDNYYCETVVGPDASFLLFFTVAVFVAPFRFYLYTMVQCFMILFMFLMRLVSFDVVTWVSVFDERKMLADNTTRNWASLYANLSSLTVSDTQMTVPTDSLPPRHSLRL